MGSIATDTTTEKLFDELRKFIYNATFTEESAGIVKRCLNTIFTHITKHVINLTKIEDAPIVRTLLEEWAAYYVVPLQYMVAVAAKKMNIAKDSEILLSVWSGSPGTGKTTNVDAITYVMQTVNKIYKEIKQPIPDSLAPLVESYTKLHSTIITGTGGITSSPTKEYKEIFGDLEHILQYIYNSGTFVGDIAMSLFVECILLVRIIEGYKKIQINVWPRTQIQLETFDQLITEIRSQGANVHVELINLRLLYTQEITAMRNNIHEYAQLSEDIGRMRRQVLMQEDNKKVFDTIIASEQDPIKRYEKIAKKVKEIMQEVKKEFLLRNENAVTIIFSEAERSVERMKYRYDISLERKVPVRNDELPHIQYNRIAIAEIQTSPAFLRASIKHNVDFISSYDTPRQVIKELLRVAITKIEKGLFPYEHQIVWNAIVQATGDVAEALVKIEHWDEDAIYVSIKNAIVSEGKSE